MQFTTALVLNVHQCLGNAFVPHRVSSLIMAPSAPSHSSLASCNALCDICPPLQNRNTTHKPPYYHIFSESKTLYGMCATVEYKICSLFGLCRVQDHGDIWCGPFGWTSPTPHTTPVPPFTQHQTKKRRQELLWMSLLHRIFPTHQKKHVTNQPWRFCIKEEDFV